MIRIGKSISHIWVKVSRLKTGGTGDETCDPMTAGLAHLPLRKVRFSPAAFDYKRLISDPKRPGKMSQRKDTITL